MSNPGLALVGVGSGGLIIRVGDPQRLFSVRHGTREIAEITAALTTGDKFLGVEQVVPTPTGQLVLVANLTELFWTDGTPETLRRIEDGGLNFPGDGVRLVDGRVFVRGIEHATNSRLALFVVDANGGLVKYSEKLIPPGSMSSSKEANADHATAGRLFKGITAAWGQPPRLLHVSPLLEKLSGRGQTDLLWNWQRVAPNVIWAGDQRGAVVGDNLYFAGTAFEERNGNLVYDRSGVELFRTDGTPEGTQLAYDFDSRTSLTAGASSNPRHLTPIGDRAVVLVADDAEADPSAPAQPSIWAFDGTKATRLVRGREPAPFQHAVHLSYGLQGVQHEAQPRFLAWGDHAYYVLGSGGRFELWQTDGTIEGTRRLVQAKGHLNMLFPSRTCLVFNVVDDGDDSRVWACDGTPEGTRPVGDVRIPVGSTWLPSMPYGAPR